MKNKLRSSVPGRALRPWGTLLAALLLTACGQKGPLVLPAAAASAPSASASGVTR